MLGKFLLGFFLLVHIGCIIVMTKKQNILTYSQKNRYYF